MDFDPYNSNTLYIAASTTLGFNNFYSASMSSGAATYIGGDVVDPTIFAFTGSLSFLLWKEALLLIVARRDFQARTLVRSLRG